MGETERIMEENGKCKDCGFSVPDNTGKSPYKFLCTTDGKRKRGDDSCKSFWEKEEMKQHLDKLAQYMREKEEENT